MHAVGQVWSAFWEAAAGLISAASNQSWLTPKVQSLTKDAVSFLDKYAPSVKQWFLDAVSGTAEWYAAFQKAHPNIAQAISDTFDASQLWWLVPIKKAWVMTWEELGNLITKAWSAVEKGAEVVAPALDVAGNVGKMAWEGAVNLATSTAENVAAIPWKIATATKEAVTKSWADIAKEKAAQIIMPISPSDKDLLQYVWKTKYKENLLWGVSELTPTEFDKQLVDAVAPTIFPHSESLPTNALGITSKKKIIERINDHIGKVSDQLKNVLSWMKTWYVWEAGKAKYKEDIVKNLTTVAEDSGIPLSSDPTIKAQFDKLIEEHLSYIDSIPWKDFTNNSVWDAKKDLANLLQTKYPRIFQEWAGKGSVLQQAGKLSVDAVSKTLTDEISDPLFTNVMKDLHLHYIAGERVAANAISLNHLDKSLATIWVQYLKNHGLTTGLAMTAWLWLAPLVWPVAMSVAAWFAWASVWQLLWAKTRNNPAFRNVVRKALMKEIEKADTPEVLKMKWQEMINKLDTIWEIKKIKAKKLIPEKSTVPEPQVNIAKEKTTPVKPKIKTPKGTVTPATKKITKATKQQASKQTMQSPFEENKAVPPVPKFPE